MSLPYARRWFLAAVVLLLTACSQDPAVETTFPPPGDLDPEGAVTALLADIQAGRFDHAAALTDTEQAALLTMAEGADASDVVESLSDQGAAVAANFWSGFAQTLDPEDDPAQWTVEAGDELVEGGRTYVPVRVIAGEGDERTFFLRQEDGWKVDMMATFGPILAERLTPPVESLLSSANPDASAVLGRLAASVPSLRVAAANADLPSATHQALLALIERITRAS